MLALLGLIGDEKVTERLGVFFEGAFSLGLDIRNKIPSYATYVFPSFNRLLMLRDKSHVIDVSVSCVGEENHVDFICQFWHG